MNNTPVEYTDFQVKTLIALGATIDGNTVACSGRKGIPYLRVKDKQYPVTKNRITNKPTEVACEHEALDMITEFMGEAAMYALTAFIEHGRVVALPQPEDFFYVFTEDVEDEPAVEDTSDAAALLATISQR